MRVKSRRRRLRRRRSWRRPPANTALPAISGEAKDEKTLTASTGTWSGSPTISYSYQWESCNTAGEGCTSISGATSATYVIAHEEVGHTIRVKVTAKNSAGEVSATSAQTATVAASAPANTVLPTISGEAKDEKTLTASTGTWTGTPTISYSDQWESCNTAGEGCTSISGATSATYVIAHEEVGHTIRVKVTAKNSAGEVSATSAQTATVVASAPVNTALPTISGEAKDEKTLTASTGTWSGSPTISYSYQWESCNTAGEGCTSISGATASSYTVTHEQVGHTLRVKVTAKNSSGEVSATSAQTATVVASAPVNTALPTISGEAKDEKTLTASTGTWSGSPTISYSYQWESCNTSGEACSNISGATASSYAIAHEQVGHTLRMKVTAKNSAGEVSATSAQTATVAASAPANTVLPTISGEAKDENTLTASTGTWTGTPTISYSYQWESCNTSGEACSNISGATASSYAIAHEQVGDTIRVKVTAKNSAGEVSATSAQTATVAASAPANTALPTISGAAKEGQTLTASTGSWNGTTPLSYAFQWQSCNSLGVGCLNISGATSSTRLLGASEVGGTVRVAVTASNAAGSTAGTSEATGVIVESPCTDTWTGSDEGAWQTPGNWSTGSVPGRTEVACLEAGATVQVTGGTNQVGVLKAEGASLKVTGGSLEIASTSKTSQAGTLVLSGGTLSVGGELGVSGSFAASGEAKVSGGGRLVVESGATGTVEGCQPLVLDGVTLANEGTVRTGVAGGGEHGEVRLEGGAVLQNSGTFDEDTYDNYACWERHAIEGSGSSASVVNSGTFNVEAGSGRTAEVTAAFTSTGSVDVRSGTFTLSNGGSSSGGSWVTGSGAAVAFTAGSYSLTGANAMAATVRLMSGTLTATGTSSTVGSLVLSGGTLSVGGELGVSGSFAASGEAKVSGGGRLVVESGATGTVEGCQPLVLDGVTLANEGTVRTGVAGGGEHGEVRLEGGAVLQNSGTFDEDTYDNYACWERHAIEGSGSSASVVNSGTFNVEAGSGRTAEVTAAFTSTGSVDVRSGTFTLSGGGSSSGAAWSVASGSQLTFAQGSFVTTGGSWSGGGAVNVTGGSVTASGVSGTGQTVGVAGGSLAIPSGSSMSVASLVLSGGTLSVGGEFGVSGSFAASGEAKVSGGGRLVVESGATGTVEGCQPLVLDGVTLANEGTVRTGVAGGGEHGEVRLEGGAVLQNSGTFDEDTYDNYVCWERHAIEGSGSSASVVNSGTFNVEAGSGRTAEVTAAFDNTGTVDVSSGTFTPAGGGSSSGGSWVTGSGAAVALTAGSYSLTGANAMAATVRLLSGTLTATGTSSTVGSLVLSGGTLSVVGELGVSGSLASGVEANVSGGGRLVVESGATGTVDVPGCSLLSLTGVTLVNEGTMTMGSAGGSAGQIDMSEGAQLQNAGTFDAYAHSANCVPGADNAAIQSNGGTTSITNTGTFDINPGSANTVSIQPEFENQGTLDVLSGSVRLSGGGIPEVPASGAWLGEDGPIVLSGGTFLVTRGSDFQTRVEGARVIWVARALTGYLSTLPSYVSGTVAVTGVGEPGVGETFSSATVEIVPAGSSSWKTLCGPLTPGLGGTFECSWETAAGAYPDGTYLLRAHLSSASPTESVTTASTDVQVDNTPPIGTLTVEAAHSYSGLTTLTGTASDAGSGVAAWQLEIEREGSSEWTNACPPQYLPLSGDAYGCTLETSKFANGGYRLRAVVSDRAGNTFTTPTQSFPIDNEVVSGTVAEPPTFVTKTLEAEGTASANATSWAVQIAPSGTLAWSSACPVQEKPAHGSTYSCQIDTGALADGEYQLRAVITDGEGDTYTTLSRGRPRSGTTRRREARCMRCPRRSAVTSKWTATPTTRARGSRAGKLQIAPAGSETYEEACPSESLLVSGIVYGCTLETGHLMGERRLPLARRDRRQRGQHVHDIPWLSTTVEGAAPTLDSRARDLRRSGQRRGDAEREHRRLERRWSRSPTPTSGGAATSSGESCANTSRAQRAPPTCSPAPDVSQHDCASWSPPPTPREGSIGGRRRRAKRSRPAPS